MDPLQLEIQQFIRGAVATAGTTTEYRQPQVGFARADDPRFRVLRDEVSPIHLMPEDLVPGAQTVVSFFLPFAAWVVEANARSKADVAREWAVAYVETNALIGRISAGLVEALAAKGIAAAAEPATHNFDEVTLHSPWSHKSVAVIAGLGSFGLHQMVITDAGCAGRFGSVVLDAGIPFREAEPRVRCLGLYDGSCLECVARCPVSALSADIPLDKQRCDQHLHDFGRAYEDLGLVDVCGKCAIGPCSFSSAVPPSQP
jgi:epoxyqueuosine reductase QueG